MMVLEGIKKDWNNRTANLIFSLQMLWSLPPNKNKPFVLSNG